MTKNGLLNNNPLWIVDVGASGGIDPRWNNYSSLCNAILFEPDPREYKILEAKHKGNRIVLNTALSDRAKDIDFHLCKAQQVSSVYLPNREFLKEFYNSERFEVTKTITMKADTLDNQLVINNIHDIDFIKLDTQGYELPILQGSLTTLKNVIGIEVEVEFVPLYCDQPLFSEVDSFLRSMDYVLIDLKRYYWKRNILKKYGRNKGQLVFGDALYFKCPEQIINMKGIEEGKILRAISVYLAYGYSDLAQTLYHYARDKKLLSSKVSNLTDTIIENYMDKSIVPYFKGKGLIMNVLDKISRMITSESPYSGTDQILGNIIKK